MLNDIYQNLDPVLFSLGPVTVRWYGVAYVLGFVCAALVIWRVARRWRVRVDADALLTIMFCVIIGVIVGGRLGYVLFYTDLSLYLANPLEVFAFNHGGMSFHGGLIGALSRASWRRAHRVYRAPHAGRPGLHRGAHRAVLRTVRELRERRAVGRAHRRTRASCSAGPPA